MITATRICPPFPCRWGHAEKRSGVGSGRRTFARYGLDHIPMTFERTSRDVAFMMMRTMPVVMPVTMMASSERRTLFGKQDSFHDFSPVHPVEGLVPVGQFPDAADDWPDVKPSGG